MIWVDAQKVYREMRSYFSLDHVHFFVSMLYAFVEEPRPFVQSSFDMQAFRSPRVFFFFFFPFFLLIWRCRFFRAFFPLYLCIKESTSYVLSFRMVFFRFSTLSCGTRAGFLTSAYVIIQSINQSYQVIYLKSEKEIRERTPISLYQYIFL